MTSPTLNGVDLGKVSSIQVEKSEDIMIVSAPTDDSDDAILAEITGATKSITVKGKLIGTNITALKTAIDNIQNLVDGDQSTGYSFVSGITGTLNVMVVSFTYVYDNESRTISEYSLNLLEGTT